MGKRMKSRDGTRILAPKQDRSAATVRAIEQAIDEVIAEHGAAQLTARRVAERAGVGLGSLYRFFRTREAMIASWELRQLQSMTTELVGVVQRGIGKPLEVNVYEVTRELALRLMRHAEIIGTAQFYSTLTERQESVQPVIPMLAAALAKADGRHPALTTDTTLAVRVAIGSVAMTSVLFANRRPTREEAEASASELAHMVTRYLVDPAPSVVKRGI